MKKKKLVEPFILTEQNLRETREVMFPCGSGPLTVMRLFCRLADAIAEEKGWDIGQKDHPLPT